MERKNLTDLERFLQDTGDLERLEIIISDFNPFVAMGWTRQELRHTAFLKWILDPSESHALGTYPLRTFLKYFLSRGPAGPDAPTLFDVDGWDLTGTTAVSEWEQIDLLLQNDQESFLVLLENKIDSREHSNQLSRYADLICKRFPSHKKCLVYLTPNGDEPSDDRYVIGSYADAVDLLDSICVQRGNQISVEVASFIRAYSEMVRRYIVEDSEVQELCRRIYAKHRQALDLIFEHRPDRTQHFSDLVRGIVSEQGATLDQCSKAYVRWTTSVLARCPAGGKGWTSSGRLLLFEVDSTADQMALKLILGPGPQEWRERIHSTVQGQGVFNRRRNKLYPKWWTFHSVKLLTRKQSESMEVGEVETHLRERLTRFFADELPTLERALRPAIEVLEREAKTKSS